MNEHLPRGPETATALEPEPTTINASPPPLRIHHILACTAVAAVLFTAARIETLISEYSIGWRAIYWVYHLLNVAFQSAAVTCLGFGVYWRKRGIAFFNEPGHGLLILSALSIMWTVYTSLQQAFGELLPPGFEWLLLSLWPNVWQLFMVGVLLAIARWMADTRPWRVFFIVSAMVTLFFVVAIVLMGHIASLFSISSIDVLYGGIGLVDAALPMVVLCFALWGDLRAGRKRHFTHWLGVAGWLTMTVSTCIIFAMMLAGLGPRAG